MTFSSLFPSSPFPSSSSQCGPFLLARDTGLAFPRQDETLISKAERNSASRTASEWRLCARSRVTPPPLLSSPSSSPACAVRAVSWRFLSHLSLAIQIAGILFPSRVCAALRSMANKITPLSAGAKAVGPPGREVKTEILGAMEWDRLSF